MMANVSSCTLFARKEQPFVHWVFIKYQLFSKQQTWPLCFHDIHSPVRKWDNKWDKWQGNYHSIIKAKNEFINEGHKEIQVQAG